ncbi:hypothetical protein N0V85_007816 [Neurospora sp. IMI 360204]|nr:hypothetical protein N0V85_007816 [Neurospora sp. IMI 360204]
MPPSHLTIRDSVQLRADILGLKYDPAEPSATSLSSVLLGIELVNNSLEEHETPRPSRRWTAHLITQACNGTIDGKGDDSQEDCVRACADNSILLGSLESLTNCVMLSTAAKLLRDGSLNVTADDVKILKIFGVHDLASFEDVPVYSSVAQCAVASCHAEALGNCSRIVWSEPDGPSNTTITGIDTFTGILAGLADSCEGFVTTIDADVAGPGDLQFMEPQARNPVQYHVQGGG